MVHADADREESDSADERAGVTRRRLIVSGAGAWTTTALAGCSYITDPGPPASGGDGSDGGDGGDTTESVDGDTNDGDGDDGETDNSDSDTATTTPVPTGSATVTNETTTTDDTSTATATATPTPTPTETECSNSREFPPGMEIGLNVGVYDSDTGEYLGADTLDSVRVEFPDADFEPLELSWSGPHEQYIPDGWGGKIETDPDIDSGTYRYEITIDGADVFEDEERIVDQFTII